MISEPPRISVEQLSKRFKLYPGRWDRLADWLHLGRRPRYKDFWALQDVSFELSRGQCLGIIGPNGAGKSTLLKLLTGALYPTSGHFEVRGRLLSLLELGTGFHLELTGRQNVQQSAQLLGFPAGYAAQRGPEIEAFAELGEYFDRPLKYYSSGMLVRLAFSLFSVMDPEVLLVDEALAVGDMRFAGKALARIKSMLDGGTTLMFVSHDLQLINQFCTRALWLDRGVVQMDGSPSEVTRAYQQFVIRGTPDTTAPAIDGAAPRDVQHALGRMYAAIERCAPAAGAPARITSVLTRGASSLATTQFATYEPFTLEVRVEATAPLDGLVVGFQVRDMLDRLVWTTRTDWQAQHLPALEAGQCLTSTFASDRLLLGRGWYQLSVVIHQQPNDRSVFHWVDGAWAFDVESPGASSFAGLADLSWRYAGAEITGAAEPGASAPLAARAGPP